MLEIFQKIILVTISIVAGSASVILIFSKNKFRKYIKSDIKKIVIYILICSIIITLLNIESQIIYLEINTVFILSILIFLINLKLNKVTKLGTIAVIGMFIVTVIVQFMHSFINIF